MHRNTGPGRAVRVNCRPSRKHDFKKKSMPNILKRNLFVVFRGKPHSARGGNRTGYRPVPTRPLQIIKNCTSNSEFGLNKLTKICADKLSFIERRFMALFWKSRDIIRILFQMLIQKPGGKVEDQMWHIKDTFEDWKDCFFWYGS